MKRDIETPTQYPFADELPSNIVLYGKPNVGKILVSAVRDDNSQTGSMHAMRILNATNMEDWQRELWVHKMKCTQSEYLSMGFPVKKPILKSDYNLAVKMVQYIDQIIDVQAL